MGTDNLFHKRKAKRLEDLERKRNRRSTYDNVLIVVEGSKSDADYLKKLRHKYRVNTANVMIIGAGASPSKIVEIAINKFDEAMSSGDKYDQVFCVFDRDDHKDFDKAIGLCIEKNKSVIKALRNTGEEITTGRKYFSAIVSVPCFEYWVYLHLDYTNKLYSPKQNKSVCDCVIEDLEKLIGEYDKSRVEELDFLYDDRNINLAISNGKRSMGDAQRSLAGTHTNMHELVEYLRDLSEN